MTKQIQKAPLGHVFLTDLTKKNFFRGEKVEEEHFKVLRCVKQFFLTRHLKKSVSLLGTTYPQKINRRFGCILGAGGTQTDGFR